MRRKAGQPSLFGVLEGDPAEVAPGHLRAEVASPLSFEPPQHAPSPERVERLAHAYGMSPAERAAVAVALPDRSRWTFEGRTVEVRGTSPLMVWFTEPGAPPTTQATRYRHEFLKKAVRL